MSSLRSVLLPYWFSKEKWGAWGLLLLLIGLLVIQTILKVVFIVYGGELTSALAAQDAERFWQSVGIFLGILVVGIPFASFSGYVREKLGLFWRTWLTHRYLDQYLSGIRFYQLRLYNVLDNPDQRIEEDVRVLSQESLRFFAIFLESGLQLIGFAGVLWTISKPLMAVLLVYSAVGSMIALFGFGRPLIGINAEQLKREADFRFDLVRIRENTEAIALYRGEARELSQSWQQFRQVLENFTRLIRWQLGLNLFQNHYRYATFVIPGIILASRVLTGNLEIGDVTQAGVAFNLMLQALALVVLQLQQLTNLGASVQRLTQLEQACRENPRRMGAAQQSSREEPTKIQFRSGESLEISNLTLTTPDAGKMLIQDLSLTLPAGKSLLIVGPSGVGKSSLLRAIAGLWQTGSGMITRPDSAAFLPQRPYLPPGTLCQQLSYPDLERPIGDAQLNQLIDGLGLGHLLNISTPIMASVQTGPAPEPDPRISSKLSLGEKQRLAFARVYLKSVSCLILDEATSALDLDNEAKLYRSLKQSGITIISVGHRPSLRQYHDYQLTLLTNGRWEHVQLRQ
ncbi:MAG: ABC transporter ATP-binding protein/permease [Cyanobacteria bacterium J06626_23]